MLSRTSSRKWLAPAALVLAAGGSIVAPKSFARIMRNTIDATATIVDAGRTIVVTGPIRNDRVQWNDLRVTVTQRTTGAVAEGQVRLRATTEVQQWVVEAEVQGREEFEAGPATAVALATTSRRGETDDAHQWLVAIELVGE